MGKQSIKQALLNSAALVTGAGLFATFFANTATANPLSAAVTTGSASITSASGKTQIDQKSEDVVIDWSSFNIGAGQTTQFVQPNAQAIAVNRIGGNAPSQILGTLDANGRIVLINGNGMLFGKGAAVNVGSLVATSTGGPDADLLSGKFTQAGNQNASVINQGTIRASQGGLVALVAPSVTNSGTVNAQFGTVALGAANKFTVDFAGDGLVSFAAQGDVNGRAIATNSGSLAGANVSLTARAAEGLATGVVSVSGTITAQTARQIGGTIVLDAGDGGNVLLSNAKLDASGANGGGAIQIGGWNENAVTVDKASALSASALQAGNGGSISVVSNNTSFGGTASARGGLAGGNGGTIETSGHTLDFGGAFVDAGAAHGRGGSWLLDPYDLTVNSVAASTIDSSLSSGTNVTLQTTATGTSGPGTSNASGNGDIFIDSPISWNTNATLTLSAYRNIDFDADVTVSGGGALSLSLATGTGTTGDYNIAAGDNISFTAGSSSGASLSINGSPYTLLYSMGAVQNINANTSSLHQDYALANSLNAANIGWTPIGTNEFGVVSNSGNGFSGVFAGLGNTIANLNYNVSSISYVGLFGYSSGTIRDIGVTGGETISDAWNYVGGLVGYNTGTIRNSYVTGSVNGIEFVGGLVGENSGGTIQNSYATGAVNAQLDVGGLAGYNVSNGTIANSFSTGPVSGSGHAGGLVGYASSSTISNSYALGSIVNGGLGTTGGLVGEADGATISDSYSTGFVFCSEGNCGGLVGYSSTPSTVTNSYWDTQTAALTTSVGGTGMTTAKLQGALPTGFGSTAWGTGTGLFPYLLSQYPSGTPQAVSGIAYSALGGSPFYLAAVAFLNNGVSYGTAIAGSNGYYYALLAPGTLSNGQFLAYIAGTSGGTLVENASGSQAGLNIYGGYLTVATASTSYSSVAGSLTANLATAIGGNSAAQSAVNGANLAIITSGSSFTIDTPVTSSLGLLIDATAADANITIDDSVTLTGNKKLTLEAGGTITQNSSDTITAAAIGGSSSGAVTLNANNDIATLDNFSTGGGPFSLTDGTALNIAGAVNAGTGAVTLNVNGAITGSGVITAATLTGSSIGATSLSGNNAIGNLGSFLTNNNAFSLNDGTALTVSGAVNAGTANLTVISGGNLTLDAPLTGSTVYVESGASIGGNSSGVITATTLTGYSGTTTSLTANNAFADLGAFTTGNGKSGINDVVSLTINGLINSGGGSLAVNVSGTGHNIAVDNALSGYIVDLSSAGSITINDPINIVYPSAGLGLFAAGALNIYAPITVTNLQGGVVLQTGFDTTTSPGNSLPELNFGLLGNISFANISTQVGALEINGTQYTVITSLAEVQQYIGAAGALSGDYALGASIDGTGTTGWVPVGTNGTGTIENSGQGFSGIFEGLGNTISNLTVSTGSSNYAGLFGYSTGTIRDLTITGGSVTGGKYAGGLVGYQSGGVISNVVADVPVTGASDVGGIAGENTGAITESSAASTVAGTIGGGLVGMNSGSLIDDYAVGTVNVSSQGGGLVGSNSGTITDDYSIASVTDPTGGLIGTNTGGTISDSYWDTQTSGASSSAAGTGLTTAQMQGVLPSGFGSPVWATGPGLFPYLLRQYPNGAPDLVSGTAYTSQGGTAAAGELLTVVEDGQILEEFDAGANGSFSTLLAPGADAVIIAAGKGGATLVENVSAPVAGLSIYGNTLNEVTNDSLYTTLDLALGEALGFSNVEENEVFGNLNVLRIDTSAPTFTIGLSWPGTVDLIAAGSIDVTGMTTGTFMGSSNGAVTISYLTVNNFGPFTTDNGALTVSMNSGTQSGSTNAISGAIDTGTGNLTINDSTAMLNIDAPLTGGAVTLGVYGSIEQSSAGIITASSLTGSAGGGIPSESATFTANNAIGSLGAFIAESGFSLTDTTPLTITGPINAGTSNLTLTATGTGNGLTINGTLTGGTVDLVSGGSISQGSGGAITASTLTGSSNGAISLMANNAVVTLGAFVTNGGSLAFTDAEALTVNTAYNMGAANLTLATTGATNNLTIDAPLTGATIDLSSDGTLTQNSTGTITATTLTGASDGAATLASANEIGTLGSFATGGGALSITDGRSLTIDGAVNSGAGNLALTTTGTGSNIVVDNAVSGSGTANLTSTGTISETGGGSIAANALNASANGAVTLTGNNEVTKLGAIATNGGALAFMDAESLTVNTTFNLGSASLTLGTSGAGDNLAIDAPQTAAIVDLLSSGTISQNSAGIITATTLAGSSFGGTTLNDSNKIGNLGAFTNSGTGGFLLMDGKAITVNGAVNTGTGNLSLVTTGTGSNIVIDGAVVDGGTATLSSAGTITEGSGGAITAATLQGSASGATTLNGANQIGSLGAFTNTGGNLALTDGEKLTVTGAVNAGTNTVTLTNQGTLGESGTGAIVAHVLEGTSSGGATLNGTNDIFDLEAFTNSGTGGIALTNDGVLNVYGAVNAGTGNFAIATVGTGSNIAIDRSVTAGGTVSLVSAGTIAESTQGLITAAALTGSAAGNTSLAQANLIGSLGPFANAGGNFSLTDDQNLTLTGALNAGGNTVTLMLLDTLAESGAGAIDAKTLSGTSTGGATLNGANKIADLGVFTNNGTGGFALTDGQALAVDGAVSAGTGDLSLTTTKKGGAISINSAVADGGTVTLISGGAITEGSAGSISAASLAGSAAKATTLNGANQIAMLAGFTNIHGNLSLTDDEGLTVEDTVNTGAKALTLQTTNGDLVIAGTIAGQTITLDSTLGEVDGSGAITAHLLNVAANTGIDLTGPNKIKKLGTNQTNSGPDVIVGVK